MSNVMRHDPSGRIRFDTIRLYVRNTTPYYVAARMKKTYSDAHKTAMLKRGVVVEDKDETTYFKPYEERAFEYIPELIMNKYTYVETRLGYLDLCERSSLPDDTKYMVYRVPPVRWNEEKTNVTVH